MWPLCAPHIHLLTPQKWTHCARFGVALPICEAKKRGTVKTTFCAPQAKKNFGTSFVYTHFPDISAAHSTLSSYFSCSLHSENTLYQPQPDMSVHTQNASRCACAHDLHEPYTERNTQLCTGMRRSCQNGAHENDIYQTRSGRQTSQLKSRRGGAL